MSNSAGNWCLIESDPGVFTELIRDFGELPACAVIPILNVLDLSGVTGLQVEELWSLDKELFAQLQ